MFFFNLAPSSKKCAKSLRDNDFANCFEYETKLKILFVPGSWVTNYTNNVTKKGASQLFRFYDKMENKWDSLKIINLYVPGYWVTNDYTNNVTKKRDFHATNATTWI